MNEIDKNREKVRAEVLTRILERDGCVRVSVLLEESRDPSSPLHNEFEWDDSKAAEEYRKNQARRIIRVTRLSGEQERLVHVPVIANIDRERQGREGYYKTPTQVASNLDEFERAYNSARRQLSAATRAVEELERAAKLRGEDDDLAARLAVALKALDTAAQAIATH